MTISDDCVKIKVEKVHPPWNILRPVLVQSVEFLELVDSIRDHGLLNSVLVRPHPRIKGEFEIIDGFWRYLATKHLTNATLPCIIKVVNNDDEYLRLQIEANAITYETKPLEFAEQMERIMRSREDVGAPMSMTELSAAVNKSVAWVSRRMSLIHLCATAKDLMKTGKLPLGKAVALARVRYKPYQEELLSFVKGRTNRDFELLVGDFIRKKRVSRDERIQEERHDFQPRLQSMDNILMELDRLDEISDIILKNNLTNATEGAIVTLEWVLNLHESGRKERLARAEERLTAKDRIKLIGRKRYEELEALRELRERRNA